MPRPSAAPTPYLQVDAFTDRPHRGNPAAVCLLHEPRDARWMQAVAAEANLSETAFTWTEDGARRLRWFTPRTEVELCGHATLAAAHALWEHGAVEADRPIAFETLSGRLVAEREGARVRLDFPALPPSEPGNAPAGLAEALRSEPVEVRRVHRPSAPDDPSWLVVLASAEELAALAPDFDALRRIPHHGVVATAAGSGSVDFLSRFFAPRVGVDEDPVTGSAHCTLAPYWCERLGRDELLGRQISARTGEVLVRRVGDRVHLLGHAVTVLRGVLLV
ncbi:MAG: PhzF family phenazine biosynthesis protein [Planctomycetota bacterium]